MTAADFRPIQTVEANARRRPSTRAAHPPAILPGDVRRTIAAAGSAVIPGLGQLINGRLRIARWFALPAILLLAISALIVAANSPARLFASLISPSVMNVALALNLIVLGWRLASVAHAFFDRRYEGRPGRLGVVGLALILTAVAAPHAIANAWGNDAKAAFGNIFAGARETGAAREASATTDGPNLNERVNILVVEPRYADPMSLVRYKKVLVTKAAIEKLKEMFA